MVVEGNLSRQMTQLLRLFRRNPMTFDKMFKKDKAFALLVLDTDMLSIAEYVMPGHGKELLPRYKENEIDNISVRETLAAVIVNYNRGYAERRVLRAAF